MFVFYNGCGSCNLLQDNIVKDNAQLPDNVHIFKIDYANQKDVMEKFDADGYHSLIYLDKDGSELRRVDKSILSMDDLLAYLPVQEASAPRQVVETQNAMVADVATESTDSDASVNVAVAETQNDVNADSVSTQVPEEVTTQPVAQEEKKQEQSPAMKAEYLAFTQANLDNALANGKDVILFVHHKGCGSCTILDENISTNLAQFPTSMTFLKINYATQSDVMKQFDVDSYHTLVFLDKQGNETNRVKGGIFTVNDIIAAQS